RHRLRISDVVRGHDLEVAAVLELGAEEVPPDPAEAVDPHPGLRHRHASARRSRTECSNRGLAGGPGSSRDAPPRPPPPPDSEADPPGPSPAGDLAADGV